MLRLLHAWNALCILGLIATGELPGLSAYALTPEGVRKLHVWLGFGVTIGFAARLVWGLVGPTYARWRDMWHLDAWRAALRSGAWWQEPQRFGHHPQASAAYLVVYALLLVMALSGLVRAALEQNLGPLTPWLTYSAPDPLPVRATHRLGSTLLWGYTVLHVGALLAHTLLHRLPLAQSMVTGRQYLRTPR